MPGLTAPVASPSEANTRTVFVEHSLHIDRPIRVVSAALSAQPRQWFPRLDGPSQAGVGPRVAGIALRKKVTVEVGEPLTTGDWTEVPVTWKATFIARLFPVMVGRVELAPVDPCVTRVRVCGMYEPPLGRLGKQLDDALLHRVAEATVRELAESIANRLEALTADALISPN
jgi:hypothetical protein